MGINLLFFFPVISPSYETPGFKPFFNDLLIYFCLFYVFICLKMTH